MSASDHAPGPPPAVTAVPAAIDGAATHRAVLEPLAVSVVEAARLLSLSRSTLYNEMADGKLSWITRRGRRLILMTDLRAYLGQ